MWGWLGFAFSEVVPLHIEEDCIAFGSQGGRKVMRECSRGNTGVFMAIWRL